MRWRALVILIAAAALVGGPNTAFACSCAQRTPDVYASKLEFTFARAGTYRYHLREYPATGGAIVVDAP